MVAIRRARELKIPYLGVCLGMQMAVTEFARDVCGMEGANSAEFGPDTPYPVLILARLLRELLHMRHMATTWFMSVIVTAMR